ncbi:MAG: type II toxin-antitoxin system HicA family toxin [Acidimicrobiia bacterium]
MKLPRDPSGAELARLLRRHGYEITRQTGSHLRMTCTAKRREHHITIPTPGASCRDPKRDPERHRLVSRD